MQLRWSLSKPTHVLARRIESKQVRLWNAFKTENSGTRDFFPSEVDPPTLATTWDTYIWNFVSCPRHSFLSQILPLNNRMSELEKTSAIKYTV